MNEKEKSLSIFFNIDRTYITLLERDNNRVNLAYVNATENCIDIENPNSISNQKGIDELAEILSEIEIPGKINVALPCESVLVTSFPSKPDISKKDIVKLVNLEVRQIYPQLALSKFSISVIPLEETKKHLHYMIAAIIENDVIDVCKGIVNRAGAEIGKIEISQFAAHNAFLYNYPELSEKNILLASFQDQFMDISILKQGKPAYYNLTAMPDPAKIAEAFENELNNITENIIDSIDSAFFFGSGLTKEINLALWETSMLFGFETKRLNPFRMMGTTVDARTKEYCSRVFHLYPAVTGVNLPAKHEKIKLIQ